MKRGKRYIAVLLLIFVTALTSVTTAQNLSGEVDRNKISIGEQIVLVVKVTDINPASKNIAAWFEMPDTINHLEVVERGKIDTIEVNGVYSFQQRIAITSFDSGQWEIPALSIVFNDRARNSTFTQTFKPIPIEVLPVDVSQLKDYHDVKEILEVKEQNLPEALITVIVIALISLIALYILLRTKSRRPIAKTVMHQNMSPLEWALAELDNLQKEALTKSQHVKQHYQKITDISRQYFYQQFHQASLHQTTDEWMVNLHSLEVDQDTKTAFFQLLRLADTVKFARYIPPGQENDQSIAIARQMLTEVYKHQQYGPPTKNKTSQSAV